MRRLRFWPWQYLLEAWAFRQAIEEERLRCNRNEETFALVVLPLHCGEGRSANLHLLDKTLRQHVRSTDKSGFLDRSSIGLLLPMADEAGGFTVAQRICDRYPWWFPEDYRIYVYPSNATAGKGRRRSHSASSAGRPVPVGDASALVVQEASLVKRLVDVSGALSGLLLLSPVLLASALAIKLTSPGPVLFKQQRDGLSGKPFTIYKFRTMQADAASKQTELRQFSEQDGPAFKLAHDPRVTPVGRYLRKTCIDELPQLWNVLRGEMSLVGPRPLDSKESAQLERWQKRRNDVVPGLTCIWQVDGKTHVSFVEWMRMDLRYIGVRNLWQDIKLIVRTAGAVLRHRASV